MTPARLALAALLIGALLLGFWLLTRNGSFPGGALPGGEQTFEGDYINGFETSAFFPNQAGCGALDFTTAYWLSAEPGVGFFNALSTATAGTPQPAQGNTVHLRFVGRLSPPGHYGHLGMYSNEVIVVRLLEISPAKPCR